MDKAVAPKKVGLALGSGSARGWAHIGVIRALAEAGMEVQCVAGTSIGALVGAALALGKLDELEDFCRGLDWRQIVSLLDVVFPRSGIIDGAKLTDFFRSHGREARIEDLPIPFRAIATDLATGREVVLDRGPLVEAVRASISIPGIFTPVSRDGDFLVDGGLVNPVPVSAVRAMGAERVIAVDLNAGVMDQRRQGGKRAAKASSRRDDDAVSNKQGIAQSLAEKLDVLNSPPVAQIRQWLSREPTPSIFEVLVGSVNIMAEKVAQATLAADPPDLLIQPNLSAIKWLEFHRAEEAIAEGHREATARLQEKWGGKG